MTWETLKTALKEALTDYKELDGKALTIEEMPNVPSKTYTLEVTQIADTMLSNSGTVGTVIVKMEVLFLSKDRETYDTNVQDYLDLADDIIVLDDVHGWASSPKLERVNNQPHKHKAVFEFYYGIRTN